MAALNLKVGDCVHYGAHGVCRVCGRESKNFDGHPRVYFTLRPTGRENILLYLPEDAEPEKVRLRRLMSQEEILKLIQDTQGDQMQWIPDSKLRREAFSRILRSGDAGEMIRMIKCIAMHRDALPEGKQLPTSDQEMLRAAQQQLYSEMAYVLSMDESQVQPFIFEQIGRQAN